MWLHHLSSFTGTVALSFFDAIGTTILGWILGLAFLCGVTLSTVRALHTKEGWDAVKRHWHEEKKFAIIYAFWCALISYGPVLVWKVGQAVYEDHMLLVRRSHSERATLSGQEMVFSKQQQTCLNNLTVSQHALRDKESLVGSLQSALASLAGPQSQQELISLLA